MIISVKISANEARSSGKGMRTVDCSHDEANLHSISSTREMCVDLLCFVLVERHESVQDVVASSGIVGTTCHFG